VVHQHQLSNFKAGTYNWQKAYHHHAFILYKKTYESAKNNHYVISVDG